MSDDKHCRFCGRHCANKKPAHEAACPDNPGMYDVYRSALDDGTGRIVTSKAWREIKPPRLFGYDKLTDHFGCSWSGVAEHYKLEPVDRGHGQHESRERRQRLGDSADKEVDDSVKAGREIERAALAAEHGFTVCRVREVERGSVVWQYMELR